VSGRRVACLALAALVVVALMSLGSVSVVVAYLAPTLLLLALLLAGCYPGECLISALARRPVRRRHRRSREAIARVPLRLLPRGGGLVASALAGRAPPAAAGGP
jgi:hypothetical protein